MATFQNVGPGLAQSIELYSPPLPQSQEAVVTPLSVRDRTVTVVSESLTPVANLRQEVLSPRVRSVAPISTEKDVEDSDEAEDLSPCSSDVVEDFSPCSSDDESEKLSAAKLSRRQVLAQRILNRGNPSSFNNNLGD